MPSAAARHAQARLDEALAGWTVPRGAVSLGPSRLDPHLLQGVPRQDGWPLSYFWQATQPQGFMRPWA